MEPRNPNAEYIKHYDVNLFPLRECGQGLASGVDTIPVPGQRPARSFKGYQTQANYETRWYY